jgi:hypothetical protein
MSESHGGQEGASEAQETARLAAAILGFNPLCPGNTAKLPRPTPEVRNQSRTGCRNLRVLTALERCHRLLTTSAVSGVEYSILPSAKPRGLP